ncbi:ent-kaur-16-ene synthase, chloroplastic isoform X1 [Iris pallida]|uniref:Ent-kaur-16-ene synthase, chloroplastic isoform X1 n=1 Tax=Iris pallida TaxID=29817 RepID=A0AAX6DRN1_IRIPA|nr:ent-kaur-16-ene synthase, chloroplastic isoform X1 [Iris pallida]
MEEPKHAPPTRQQNQQRHNINLSLVLQPTLTITSCLLLALGQHRRPPHLPPLPSPRSHRLVFFFFFIFLFLFKSFFLVLFKSEEER